jgi:hypothetical protein
MQANQRALTIWMLDGRHLCILTGCIKDPAIVGYIPVSHVFVQPIQPVIRQRDKARIYSYEIGLTNRSLQAYNQQSQVAHREAQMHSRDG